MPPAARNGHDEAAEEHTQAHPEETNGKMSWRRWLAERFNWSWFTCTQSTGGVAIALSECPKSFDGIQTAGSVLFVFNLALFLAFTALLVTRWITTPSTFRRCFTKAPECFFYGSFWLSIATIIICMDRFGTPHAGPWLVTAIRVCFWVYAAISLLSTTIHFIVISKYTEIRAIEMNPAWFLTFYITMLTGTVAAAIAENQPPEQRVPILVAGTAYQGVGWLACMLILSWFFGRLMEKGWPPAHQTPGLFMTVGSVGFTIVAFIGSARAIPPGVQYFAAHPSAQEILLVLATWVSIFMWAFAVFLFGVAFFVTLASSISRKNGRLVLPIHYNNAFWGKLM
jgi:tellurite resistance protein TehA-like permease